MQFAKNGTGIYFSCSDLGTANTAWVDVKAKSITVTFEGSGVATGKLVESDSTSKTFGTFTGVMVGAYDTFVVPNSLVKDGSGKIDWYMSNVNPYWVGTCKQNDPTGDQCMPLVQLISPIDSSANPVYKKLSIDKYTVTVADSKVGDFFYDVAMKTSGILCTQGDITPVSCSALVADKIGSQAFKDGSSAGQPYVSKRTATADGYSWEGGVHDPESGDFAYTVTTDSDSDGCSVTGIATAP